MPALPAHLFRRTATATPTKHPQQDIIWHRVLHVLGLEELGAEAVRQGKPAAADTPSDEDLEMASQESPALTTDARGNEEKKLSFLDLPTETKKEVFKHASSLDLISLSLVSKQFRDLAAEQIYRSFHILFPDDDDPSNDYSFDSLAGGLETFVTSEYNYTQHLKEFIMETQSGGDKGERAYRHYLSDQSCGKFMNTLLLLTLRKARVLETFRWDIRVELSRPVFKALHQIQPLQHLHLRMQAGASIYQPLPPLSTSLLPPVHGTNDTSPPNGQHLHPLPPVLPVPVGSANSFNFGHKIAKICQKPQVTEAKPVPKPAPPTLSGFKNMRSLTVLDMDSLEYVEELRDCVKNSSATLNNLTLSFSTHLANKCRKPPPDPQSDDDSDQEDEFGQLIPPPGLPPNPAMGASDPNGPMKALKAQEHKKQQEAALGTIFGSDNTPSKPKLVATKPDTKKAAKLDTKLDEDPSRRFILSLAPIAAKLMNIVEPGGDKSDQGKETLAVIEKAAQMFIDSIHKGKEAPTISDGSNTPKATPASSAASIADVTDVDVTMCGAAGHEPGLFDKKEKKKSPSDNTDVSNPDDIDVEEPEANEITPELEEFASQFPEPKRMEHVGLEGEGAPPETTKSTDTHALEEDNNDETDTFRDEQEQLQKTLNRQQWFHETMETKTAELQKHMKKLSSKLQGSGLPESEIAENKVFLQEVTRQFEALAAESKRTDEVLQNLQLTHEKSLLSDPKMTEYVRSTRGLTLESLAIHLIPIKASVISRAIDLNVLQSITLLNVGPQAPFWNLLVKENKKLPLPLHKIHTDNVNHALIIFLSQLEKITELYLMERPAKDRAESTAAKTTVTIDHIRKVVLRKHAHNLRILSIRNDTMGQEWDLNNKTVLLLCERAKNLEELACSFSVRTIHTLLQFMPGLTSLRVLHTIAFRSDDQCAWVLREFRKFTVDIIAHNPAMKLEYLALDTSVERLVRRKPTPQTTPQDTKGKGKEKSTSSEPPNLNALTQEILGLGNGMHAITSDMGAGMEGTWVGVDAVEMGFEDSEDEEGGVTGAQTGLRVETVDGIRFSDVVGVKVFDRVVVTGRL